MDSSILVPSPPPPEWGCQPRGPLWPYAKSKARSFTCCPPSCSPHNTNSTKLILQATVHPQIELKHLNLEKTQTCFQRVESLSPSELCCLQMHYRVYQVGLNI